MTILERAAKAAYEKMVLTKENRVEWRKAAEGTDLPKEIHSWENQSQKCRDGWIACVKAAFEKVRYVDLAKLDANLEPVTDRIKASRRIMDLAANDPQALDEMVKAVAAEPVADTPLEVEAGK